MAVAHPDGGVLVVDCREGSRRDARLVGLIPPDEPRANSRILAELYLADATRGSCRALSDADLEPSAPAPTPARPQAPDALDADGYSYRIRVLASPGECPELRWTRTATVDPGDRFLSLTLPEVTAAVEAYEPARAMSESAIAALDAADGISSAALRAELDRLLLSPIVLNRGLREAVARALASGTTMSEIAMRCGRVKHDGAGNRSGETSWLGRRVGWLPEGGRSEPTRWIHSNTLALVAREGLGLSPNEVEL